MKQKPIKFSLGVQHLLLYLLLFSFPVLILGYTVHFYVMEKLQDEVRISNEKELTQVKEVIDSKLMGIQNLSYTVSSKREFSPNYLTNYRKVMDAKEFLNHKIFDDFFYDILYYSRKDGFLFSYHSSYTMSNFLNNHYQYKNWSSELFLQDLNESGYLFIRPSEKLLLFNDIEVNMITYGIPIPLNSSIPYGTLLFLINEQVIKNMLSNIVGPTDGFAYILTGDGEVIASFNGESQNVSAIFDQLVKSEEQFQTIDLDDDRYYVSNVTSAYNDDWFYIAGTPESQLMASVSDVKQRILISYVCILLVGAVLIYFAMKLNYQPVRNLIAKVTENSAVTNRTGIDRVLEVITQSTEMNKTLTKRVEKNEPIIQQHLLISLLCGEIESYQQLNELGTDVNLLLNESSYFVMLFYIDESGLTNLEKNEWVKKWVSFLPNQEKHNVYLLETSTIATILSGEMDINELNKWYDEKVKNHKYKVTVGVGTSYQQAIEVGKSHIEATTALDYKLIKGKDKIIFFDELSTDYTGISWYDKQVIEELGYHIRQKNKEQLEKSINEILTIIKRKNTNLFMAKSLYFEVSSILMQLVDEMRSIHKEEMIELPSILQINDFRSIRDIEATIQTMVDKVYQLYIRMDKDQEDDLMNQIIDYMEANYNDYQFSTSTLADYFTLSEAYIMRYFKKHTGRTILQYLTKLRLDHAKQLLKTTDLRVKDIVNQVGYSDVSSFIRLFKRETKHTPGEYRKRMADK